MLRIIASMSAKRAKGYYTKSDYYIEGQEQELAGMWKGEAAARLGLSGKIEQADWEAICDNRNPVDGNRLTQRQRANRRVGFDFNWHVPKSVSVLYAMTGDCRILDAFRESVDATMKELENEMKARERKGGKDKDYVTGNMLWGEFVHFTSRPVDGVPDPHLHAHCFVANATWSDKESRWVAAQIGDLKRDAPYFEARFHSRMASRMTALGIEVERTRKGWEIAEVPKSALSLFSRRTAQVEELARAKGITDPHAKAELGAKTRNPKQKDLTLDELRQLWRSQLAPQDAATIDLLGTTIGGPAIVGHARAASVAIEYASSHCFERQSVVPERQVMATALKRSLGQASPQAVENAMERTGLVAAERKGVRMVTTREVLAEESAMLKFARDGRGTCPQLGKGKPHEFKRKELNEDQRRAVLHVLESYDRVLLVRGAAGTGKTYSLQETVEAIEANGTEVFAFAPSAEASRGVLRDDAKLPDADTVARLLIDERLQQEIRGQVIWIDEASLLGTRDMARVFDLAERLDARVVLSGDVRQHGSVTRGSALRLLETEAGLVTCEIRHILRQKDRYRSAVQALSEGRTADGFEQLDKLGWIHEVDDEQRYRAIAADYVDAVARGEKALVIAPTHAEIRACTSEIRRELRERGRLGDEERPFRILTNANLTEAQRSDAACYCPGDVLVYHQNAPGHRRGQRVVVQDDPCPLPLDQASRFQVFETSELRLAAGDTIRVTRNGTTMEGHIVRNGATFTVKGFCPQGNIVLANGWNISKDWGFIAHGHAITSHQSQGKSVDRAFVASASVSYPAVSSQGFYVAASRAKRQITFYTDDKAALLEAVRREDERLSATDLVAMRLSRVRAMAMQSRTAEPQPSEPVRQVEREREAIVR